jgi:endonuclease YncB( thermonuclease family)
VSEPAAELSGEVVKVIDGTSLAVRGDDRHFYSIALLGAVPLDKANSPSRGASDPGKARLADLVLSNKVDVTLTWMDERKRGVGVVHMGRTNVNAVMVESGLVKLNRQFIKPLPLIDQYALIRAERKANERRLAAAPNH